MSVQSDAVSAFAGITHLIGQGTNTKFWYGMPEFAFDRALLWLAREPLSRRRDQNGVALFPSWAWAAWQGRTSYQGKKWHNADNRPSLSVVEWMVALDREQVLRDLRESNMPEDARAERIARLEGANVLLAQPNSARLYHVKMRDSEWVLTHEDSTQHVYTHDAYKGVKFDYPIFLPGESVDDRPDQYGTLRFRGRIVPAKMCDVPNTDYTQEPLQDRFLQIGLGDGESTQRIIYHQGYRAGVLSLNVADEDLGGVTDIDGEHSHIFIAAMSRDSLQEIPQLASEAFFQWQSLDSRLLQIKIFGDEWEPGPDAFTDFEKGTKRPYGGYAEFEEWILSFKHMVIRSPDGTVTPDPGVKPVIEDGDPYWDEGRFGEPGYCDVYNVLLIRVAPDRCFERVAAGRMNYNAFHHARPTATVVPLK